MLGAYAFISLIRYLGLRVGFPYSQPVFAAITCLRVGFSDSQPLEPAFHCCFTLRESDFPTLSLGSPLFHS